MRSKAFYAEARVTETFPCEFPVDLIPFFKIVAMFKQPHLLFVDRKHIRIIEADGLSEAIYNFDPEVEEKALAFSTTMKPSPLAAEIDFLITAAEHNRMRRTPKTMNTRKFNMGFVSDGKRIVAHYLVPSEKGAKRPTLRWSLKGDPHGITCAVTLAQVSQWPLFDGGYRGAITEHFTTLTGLDVTYTIAHEPESSWFGIEKPGI